MMGEEGKPGKKVRLRGRGKRPDRPPENPVVDVSFTECIFLLKIQLEEKDLTHISETHRHVHFEF